MSSWWSKYTKITFNYIFHLSATLIILVLGGLFSCETKSKQQVVENEPVEKNLRISLTENIKSLNPLKFTNQSEIFLAKQLYEGLYARNAFGELIQQLVEKVELDTVTKKYMFYLKRGRKFSNGDVLTTKDIYTCFKPLFRQTNVSAEVRDFRANVVGFNRWWTTRNLNDSDGMPSGFHIVDDYSFTISVLRIDETMIENFSETDFLIYEQQSEQDFIGSGPFRIEYANDDISYNLKRNTFYSSKINSSLIDGINIRFIKNPNAVLDEFINGSLDVLSYKTSDRANNEIEKAIANNYDYKDYVQQYSGLVRFMLFHNFEERSDIKRLASYLQSKPKEDLFIGFSANQGWEYDSINFEVSEGFNTDTTGIDTIPVVNKSQLDNNDLLQWLNVRKDAVLFKIVSSSGIDPYSRYIVIDEVRLERLGAKSPQETMKLLVENMPNQKPNLGITVIGYEHDLIIFDERFSGFTKFGDWSLDIKNLTYTQPRLIK